MNGPLPLHPGAFLDYYHLHGVPQSQWSQITEVVTLIDNVWFCELLEFKAKEAGNKP